VPGGVQRLLLGPNLLDVLLAKGVLFLDEVAVAGVTEAQVQPPEHVVPVIQCACCQQSGVPLSAFSLSAPSCDKGGLLALQLAEAVMRGVRCGFNDTTEKFYVYDGGVWVPNVGRIEAEIGRLLGNHYRKSHRGHLPGNP
jgi:hypothetical protein